MKKFVLGCLMMTSLSIASAQDFCCPPECDPCCYSGSFDGFYIGGNVGVLSHVIRRNDLDGFLTDNAGWTFLDTSVAGGVQGGFDWQCGSKVLGIAADWSATNAKRTFPEDPNDSGDTNYIKSELDWYTTIRGRAGLAVCDAFVYITAGGAVAHFKNTWRDNDEIFPSKETRWGWTGGAGTELKFSNCLSLGAEVLFMHFDERTKTFTDSFSTRYSFGHNDSLWDARISLNYRFGNWCCN